MCWYTSTMMPICFTGPSGSGPERRHTAPAVSEATSTKENTSTTSPDFRVIKGTNSPQYTRAFQRPLDFHHLEPRRRPLALQQRQGHVVHRDSPPRPPLGRSMVRVPVEDHRRPEPVAHVAQPRAPQEREQLPRFPRRRLGDGRVVHQPPPAVLPPMAQAALEPQGPPHRGMHEAFDL